VDLAFSAFKVAVEYQGQLHGARYAQDIERIEALRRDGWIVIQVTSALIGRRELLAARVRGALESRGWHH
jgi:very-short-patch-repair endonuclease